MKSFFVAVVVTFLASPLWADVFTINPPANLNEGSLHQAQSGYGGCISKCKSQLDSCHRQLGRLSLDDLRGEKGQRFVGCVASFNSCIQGCSGTLYGTIGVK